MLSINCGCFLLSSLLWFTIAAATTWHLKCDTKTPSECKAQFAVLFEKGCQLSVVQYAEKSCDILENAINEDLLIMRLEEHTSTGNLMKLNTQLLDLKRRLSHINHNNEEILAAMLELAALGEMYLLTHNSTKLDAAMKFSLAQLTDNVVHIWQQLYADLRSTDLEKFPEYLTFNKDMKAVAMEKDDSLKSQKFESVLHSVEEFFGIKNLYYFG